MIIKVKGYLTFRDIFGYREIMRRDDIPITFRDFLRELADEIGGEYGSALFDQEMNSVGRSVAIMLNGLHYNQLPEQLNTMLQDQDEIAIFPPGAGGWENQISIPWKKNLILISILPNEYPGDIFPLNTDRNVLPVFQLYS